jgi:hypothetical protein
MIETGLDHTKVLHPKYGTLEDLDTDSIPCCKGSETAICLINGLGAACLGAAAASFVAGMIVPAIACTVTSVALFILGYAIKAKDSEAAPVEGVSSEAPPHPLSKLSDEQKTAIKTFFAVVNKHVTRQRICLGNIYGARSVMYDRSYFGKAVIRPLSFAADSPPNAECLSEDLRDVSLVDEDPSFIPIARFVTGLCREVLPFRDRGNSSDLPTIEHAGSTFDAFYSALKEFSKTGYDATLLLRPMYSLAAPTPSSVREIFKKALDPEEPGGIQQILRAVEADEHASENMKTAALYIREILPIIKQIDLELQLQIDEILDPTII